MDKIAKALKNKAFSLIELIVVMAVIAILVLLAVPRFRNYTLKARQTQMANDIKVVEQLIEEYLILHDTLPAGWAEKPQAELDDLLSQGLLIEVTGPATVIEPGPYKVVDPTLFPTNLPGDFFGNDKGKVYYEDEKRGTPVVDNNPDEPEAPKTLPMDIRKLYTAGDVFNDIVLLPLTVGHAKGYNDLRLFTMEDEYLLKNPNTGEWEVYEDQSWAVEEWGENRWFEFSYDTIPAPTEETNAVLYKVILDIGNYYYIKTEFLKEPYSVYNAADEETYFYRDKLKYTLYDRNMVEKGSRVFTHSDPNSTNPEVYYDNNFYFSRPSNDKFNITMGYYVDYAWASEPPITFDYVMPAPDTSNPRVIDRTVWRVDSKFSNELPGISAIFATGNSWEAYFPSDPLGTPKTVRMYLDENIYVDIVYEIDPTSYVQYSRTYPNKRKVSIYKPDGSLIGSFVQDNVSFIPYYKVSDDGTKITFTLEKAFSSTVVSTTEFIK